MRRFHVHVLALLLVLALVGVCFGHEEAADAVDTPTAEKAAAAEVQGPFDDWYTQLNLRSGVLWNVDTEAWSGFATVPVIGYRSLALEAGVEIDTEELKDGPTAWLVGLTYNLGDLQKFGVDVSWAENFGLNFGPVLRYEYGTGEKQLAFVLSVVDLSLDDGNVDRQRGR